MNAFKYVRRRARLEINIKKNSLYNVYTPCMIMYFHCYCYDRNWENEFKLYPFVSNRYTYVLQFF